MTDGDRYELSLLETNSVVKKTEEVLIEVVNNTLTNERYVKKTYYEDKRETFGILEGIESPYIATVKKVYFGSETIVIEEFVEGELLSDLINAHSKINAKSVIDSLLLALDALHSHGIIHRDIKPSNIMVRANGEAVLFDYSIARKYDANQDRDTTYYGTQGYAAPEQYGFSQSDFKSDVYALGKTLEKLDEVYGLPSSYKKIIKKCTAFDPSKRYQSVKELLNEIRCKRIIKNVSLAVILACCIVILVFGRNLKNEEDGGVVVENNYESHLISLPESDETVVCFPVGEEQLNQKVKIGGKTKRMSAFISGTKLKVSVDNTSFDFEFEYSGMPASYEDTDLIAEILIYDLDGDGTEEVIPMICDGRYVEESDIVLGNETTAWCIYQDKKGKFVQAKGEAKVVDEKFKINDSSPGVIRGDFPEAYYLKNGSLVKADDI